MKPLIIYHGNCPDGTAAATAAYLKFGEEAEYRPASHGVRCHLPIEKRSIYLLDFTYPRPIVEAMLQAGADVHIVDHHKTAEPQFHDLPVYKLFDTDHSAAVLAWIYFHRGTEIPALSRYVEDRDLWRWELPHSEQINAALAANGLDFREWARLIKHWDLLREEFIRDGEAILLSHQQLADDMEARAEKVELSGHWVPAVNASVLFSEVAISLAEEYPPFAIAWHWDGAVGLYRVSLRSVGEFDVSLVATAHGGGGHRNSAGFTCKELPWRKRDEARRADAVYDLQ